MRSKLNQQHKTSAKKNDIIQQNSHEGRKAKGIKKRHAAADMIS